MYALISANQIKAARAYLGWSQDDLAAAANLSITTVRSLETGHVSLRSAREVRKAFEVAGLEFTEGEGVRRRVDEVRIYQTSNSCDLFFEDMLQTVRDKGGEVLVMIKSQDMLMHSCGVTDLKNPKQLALLNGTARVKCLLSENTTPLVCMPSFKFRMAPKHILVPSSYYLYGDKLVIVLCEGRTSFRFVVFAAAGFAQDWRTYFTSLWESAVPTSFETTQNSVLPRLAQTS